MSLVSSLGFAASLRSFEATEGAGLAIAQMSNWGLVLCPRHWRRLGQIGRFSRWLHQPDLEGALAADELQREGAGCRLLC